ncbi:MAG: exopolyphosphatase [Oscillospiraceae bacterium]|jgi:nanoRNase/pAp phosphatase (c-di-AMP/oligoRNAs hydrolase)|nr:exopolyphosphatase [Oscillospiraceae bacterium]
MQLLTRSDFDGLACGAVLSALNLVDSVKFVHPKDIQDGLVQVSSHDVLANIPYVKGAGLWFDHHSSESERLGKDVDFKGVSRIEDSAARVIYEYYGGREKLPHLEEMIVAVDKVDSGKLAAEDILNPTGWVLLGFICDPRTGLGRFRNFRISNYDLMLKLMKDCGEKTIDEIMADPDVADRVKLYFEQDALFREMVKAHTVIRENVIVSDLRGVENIYTGNRFLVYSLYPEQNISVWIVDGRGKQNCPIAVGYSILNRSAKTDVGALMLKYGGGGHHNVGTCQVDYDDADKAIGEIVDELVKNG